MTKLLGWLAATAIAAGIVTATPAAVHAAGMRVGRHVASGGFHNPACFRHHRHFCKVVFVGGPFFYDYVPYFDWVLHDGTYCWQQVWTPSGWQWFDVCPGYHGYAY